MLSPLKKTVLYDQHITLKAKMVDFAGFEMPIQYEGILQEHTATRTAVGLFDVSHMGKFMVTGSTSREDMNQLITNDLTTCVNGQAIYSPMCYEDGGVVDDILVYQIESDKYLLVVNAANIDKDYDWIEAHIQSETKLNNITEDICQIAVQGPKALALLNTLTEDPLENIPYYWFKDNVSLGGHKILVSRTGYTGEDGFELYASSDVAEVLWQLLLDKGQTYGIKPCGLGARDTLRFEAGMPLYGNEISASINPLEAGLSYFVKLAKPSFIGKPSLEAYKSAPERKLVGFELIDKGIARHGAEVVDEEGNTIGVVTTGYKSPTFDATLGFALIPSDYKSNTITIQVRKRQLAGKIINKRFLKTYNSEV